MNTAIKYTDLDKVEAEVRSYLDKSIQGLFSDLKREEDGGIFANIFVCEEKKLCLIVASQPSCETILKVPFLDGIKSMLESGYEDEGEMRAAIEQVEIALSLLKKRLAELAD